MQSKTFQTFVFFELNFSVPLKIKMSNEEYSHLALIFACDFRVLFNDVGSFSQSTTVFQQKVLMERSTTVDSVSSDLNHLSTNVGEGENKSKVILYSL